MKQEFLRNTEGDIECPNHPGMAVAECGCLVPVEKKKDPNEGPVCADCGAKTRWEKIPNRRGSRAVCPTCHNN